ncbi:EF-hand domain-containing protein [Tieghemostelium lacteum]|uniref:EF-hand domain-containing protein n=1 Tax=Tieghemostelium lacteum TaxID=361077 RepID=A0A152A889_TIELA|nr:EF-hand domain-containing protein [Tieghemostelium lacteum]|eukprot:KYR02345.1 EF-hand domain-containing protein [Tieghemostelium lacteum]
MNSNDKDFIKDLFKKLDVNNDGRLSKSEIKDGFFKLKIPSNDESINNFIQNVDDDKDGTISFSEFEKFTNNNLIQLKKVFNELDSDHNGSLDIHEIEESIKKLGLPMYSEQELARLFHRIDTNKDNKIDFNEWRELLILLPNSSLSAILAYWKDAHILDAGDDNGGFIPPPPSVGKAEKSLSATLTYMAAGATAGVVSRTLTAPMERVKITYQINTGAPKSLMDTFRSVYADGGFRGLFRGNFANILKVSPESAVKFATFEAVKKLFAENDSELTSGQRFTAGAVAGIAAHTSLFPLEVVRTRLTASSEYKGIFDCIVKTAKSEGYIVPFYRGLTASILSTIPHSGINMMVYETLKHEIIRLTNNPYPSSLQLLTCASISSVCGQLVGYPFHVIKTRIITKPDNYKGLLDGISQTVKKEGFKGLYRGIIPNFMKSIPSHGITFVTYEFIKKNFNIHKEKKH